MVKGKDRKQQKRRKVDPKGFRRRKRLIKLSIALFSILFILILIASTIGQGESLNLQHRLVRILLIVGILSIVAHFGTGANMKMAIANEQIKTRNLPLELDELGYWTFTNEPLTKFKILQLADIHLGNGFLSFRKDKKALKAIKKLVHLAQPDLIIVTGDMVYPVSIQAGSVNNLKATKLFATFMNSFGIPWTITYGNHDEELYSLYSLESLSKVYEGSDNCLFQRGPEDITGMSNHFINILNHNGTINTSLVLFDSNSYVSTFSLFKYDNIHENQVEWYEKQLYAISENYGFDGLVPSLAFFHIPVNEFDDAWQLYREGSNEIIYHYGKTGRKSEKVRAPVYKSSIFDKMVELGSTKGIFVGHDHCNSFSVTYKGIRLTYCKSIDYLAYPRINRSKWQRGGTVIEIDEDGNFEVSSLLLT